MGGKELEEKNLKNGPVAPLIRFNSEEEVIKKSNNTKYGLASHLYTNNLSRAYRVSKQLDYGIVGRPHLQFKVLLVA